MSTRRSPSLSKNSEKAAFPAGGEFLFKETSPATIFTPVDLSPEARLMAHAMEDFVRCEVIPVEDRLEAHESGLLRDLTRKAGRLGLLAGGLPEPYGLGLPKTTMARLAEKSAASLSFAVTVAVHAGVAAQPLLFFGTEEQKERYLPRIARGEIVAAFALTEANAGSDALAAQTQARLSSDGKRYLLDGTKLWVTNAGIADLLTVFAQIEGTGMAAFLVDRSTPGLTIGPEEHKLGLQASSTCRVMLNQMPVEIAQLLGEPGAGHRPALYALNLGRFQIGAIALGGAKEALRIATAYACQRHQSGREIAEFGLVQQKLARMAARIFVLESMIYRTAGSLDAVLDRVQAEASAMAKAAEEYTIECALTKFYGTEALGFAVDEALQIHGGYGFSEDYPIARLYRDARVFRIFEGTNEINRLAVSQQIRRRIERGRLPMEEASDRKTRPISWPPVADAVRFAGVAVANIRQVAVAVLNVVLRASGNQEEEAALAELCAILYGLESAWLRVAKVVKKQDRLDCQSLLSSLLIAADTACTAAAESARAALASVSVEPGEARNFLAPLYRRPLIDTSGLHKDVAREIIEHGGYPW